MTAFTDVYDAFLSKILDDEWGSWAQATAEADWKKIMESALPWFKFPRVDLSYDSNGFVNTLSNEEIQIIATYMKCEWLNRSILTWDNVKAMYIETDYSPANILEKLKTLLELELSNAQKLEANYYRSVKGKPFDFSRLTKQNDN